MSSDVVAAALLALALAGCGQKTPPVCEPGSVVEIEAYRWSTDDGCWRWGVIPGQCEAWSAFLEDRLYTSGQCNELLQHFTEAATGECLWVTVSCSSTLNDPRYLDCSASTDPECCAGRDYPICYVE